MSKNYTIQYFEQAASNALTDEIMYESFLAAEFPYYNLGSVLEKYFNRFNININDENALKQFCSGKCITLNKIRQILDNKCSLSRTDIIKLCFFFNLKPDEADVLLHDFRHCSFHYRNFDDLIYAVHLKEKLSFKAAKEMVEKYKDIYSKQPINNDKNINYGKQAISYFITESHTSSIKEQVNSSEFSIESLEAFLNTDGINYLSEISLTTTSLYFKLFNEIQVALTDSGLEILYKELEENPKITNTDMCHLISSDTHPINNDNPNKALLDLTNKGFLSNLSELLHYKELRKKISRNNLLILLLLHVSTIEKPDWEEEWLVLNEEEETISKEKYIFNQAVAYINNTLEKCTFPRLHSRVPLDYMILSSLTSEDPHEAFTNTWKSFVENPNI